MFTIEQMPFPSNEWQVVADFGNPDFEAGEVIESGFETSEEAEAMAASYTKNPSLTPT